VDVLNTHSSTDSWLGAVACATLGDAPPVVRTRHVSTTVHDNLATRWLYRHGNSHIVTTGESIRHQIASSVGVSLDQMTSVPTGIDLARFIPGNPHVARGRLGLPDRPTLGIVATMRAWKGHSYLFDALAATREAWKDWQVLVVGGGPDGDVLKAYVDRAGLADLVSFTGHQEDVVPWLQSLDLFVLPSWGEEGVPQAVMQAMACGIPVVSTNVGAIGEAVEDGVTGLFAEKRSAPSLATKLVTLKDDPSLRSRFSAASRAKADRVFGIDRMLDAMERVFRSVQ
jgi:glycosyltransferase involved in cell wall biosynthesis